MHSHYWCICLTFIAPSTPPTNFGGSVENATAITLFWGPPLPEDTNGEITGYTASVISTESNETLYLTADSTHQTLTSLKPFTIYSITIAAQTAVGIGPVSRTLLSFLLQLGMRLACGYKNAAHPHEFSTLTWVIDNIIYTWITEMWYVN